MKKKHQRPAFIKADRRRFMAGVTAAGGAAALAAKGHANELTTPSVEIADEGTQGKGYEMNAHIRRYYEINRR